MNYEIIEHSVNLLSLVPSDFLGMSDKKRIKLLFRYLFGGYRLFYLSNKDEILGYCFLKHNWMHKYSFMNKDDVIINPYYVEKKLRGRDIATRMMEEILSKYQGRVFALVSSDNIPSIKVMSRTMFQIGFATHYRWQVTACQNPTELLLFSNYKD